MSSAPIEVLGSDYPHCAHPGCKYLAQDGYCTATCCANKPPKERCFCTEHSHRPQLVLDSFAFGADKDVYSREDVLRIVRSMWMGAGLVIESAGHFAMLRDLREKRLREGCDACRNWKPGAGAKVLVAVSKCEVCGRVLRASREGTA